MAEQKEKKKYIFRRIHGHIVPIAVGGGLVGAGAKGALAKYHSPSPERTFYTMHKNKNSLFRHDQAIGWHQRVMQRKSIQKMSKFASAGSELWYSTPFDGSGFHTLEKKVYIAGPSRAILMHELGHAEQTAKGALLGKGQNFFRNVQNANYKFISSFGLPIAKIQNRHVSRTLMRGHNALIGVNKGIFGFAQDSARLLEETDAWRRAYKHAKSGLERKAILLGTKKFLPSYLIPLKKPVGKLAIATGASLIGYGIYNSFRGK